MSALTLILAIASLLVDQVLAKGGAGGGGHGSGHASHFSHGGSAGGGGGGHGSGHLSKREKIIIACSTLIAETVAFAHPH